jgi:hypothetical protein
MAKRDPIQRAIDRAIRDSKRVLTRLSNGTTDLEMARAENKRIGRDLTRIQAEIEKERRLRDPVVSS